jgi:4-amino-4-deoxy-L-arabinose transferase-like glycosyltransferase
LIRKKHVIDTSRNIDSLKQDRSEVIALLALALIIGICAATSLLSPTLRGDERDYHFPLSLKFASEFPKFDFITNYSSANAPLPYVLVATVMQVFGTHVYVARATTMIVSLTCMLLFASLVRRFLLDNRLLLVGLLFFQPHFVLTSFVFFTPLYGMVFALAFLVVWLREGPKDFRYCLTCGALLSLAVLSQQFYLMFVIPFVLDIVEQGWHHRSFGAKDMWSTLGFFIPLALPALLFYSWHGLVLPEFRFYKLSLRIENLVVFFIFCGFYFLPVGLQGVRTITRWKVLAVVGAFALFFLFRPAWSEEQTATTIAGPVLHLCSVLGTHIPQGELLGQAVLYFLGFAAMFHGLSSARAIWQKKLYIGIASLLGSLVFLEHFMERHFLPLMPLLVLLLHPMLRERKHLILWIVIMGIFGISYFIDWMFVKPW